MRFAAFLFSLAFLLPAAASASELLRVYQLALDHDTVTQSSQGARDAALEAKPQARGLLLPQITGGAGLNWDHTVSDQSFSSQCPTATPGVTVKCRQTLHTDNSGLQKTLNLNLSQVIFNWAYFEKLKQAGDQVAAAELSYQTALQDLIVRVAQAYFDVLGAADTLRFTKVENESVSRQLEQAKQRFEVGLSAVTDVQEAQARFDLTTAEQLAAEQALRSAQDALAQIVGTDEFRQQPLRDEIPLVGPNPADVQNWLKAAEEHSPEIAAAQIQAQIAQRQIAVDRAGHYPTLALTAGKSYADQPDSTRNSETVGLALNLPIFSGGITQSQVRGAQATYRQRQADLEGARRGTARSVRDAYDGVITGISRVKALNQAVVSNNTALEASQVGLQVGTRTAVDVLNAQQQLFSAQRDYSRSRYDYLINVLRLKRAAGRLTQADLADIDHLLADAAAPEATTPAMPAPAPSVDVTPPTPAPPAAATGPAEAPAAPAPTATPTAPATAAPREEPPREEQFMVPPPAPAAPPMEKPEP